MILTFINPPLSGVYDLRMETVWQAYGRLRVNLSVMIVNRSVSMTQEDQKINQSLMYATKAGAI
jgi:hypothetical protein